MGHRGNAFRAEWQAVLHVLGDGVAVGDGAQHHALDDGAVLLLRQAAMGHQRRGQLGGRRRVHALQPLVPLDLVQRGPLLGFPLQHVGDESGWGEG